MGSISVPPSGGTKTGMEGKVAVTDYTTGTARVSTITKGTNYGPGSWGVMAIIDRSCSIVKVSGAAGYNIIHNGTATYHRDTTSYSLVKGDIILAGNDCTFKFSW